MLNHVMKKTFKILLVGDREVGKTTFSRWHANRELDQNYTPTIEPEVYPLIFMTNYGQVSFNVWDIPGDTQLADDYCLGANAAIIMFDINKQETYNNVEIWEELLKRKVSDITIGICCNRSKSNTLDLPVKYIGPYYKDEYHILSDENYYNYDRPFLALARKLMGHLDLEFIEGKNELFNSNELTAKTMKILNGNITKMTDILTDLVDQIKPEQLLELIGQKHSIISDLLDNLSETSDNALLLKVIKQQQKLITALLDD